MSDLLLDGKSMTPDEYAEFRKVEDNIDLKEFLESDMHYDCEICKESVDGICRRDKCFLMEDDDRRESGLIAED